MSASSPPTGAASSPHRSASGAARGRGTGGSSDGSRGADRLEIGLEHARWRHFGWAIAGLVPGGFLVTNLGSIGQGVGAVLIAFGLWATWSFVRTLLFPAGTIVIDGARVSLPRGLCARGSIDLGIDQVRHAYFLRRAVPWTRAAPVLVVETDSDAHMFPRDWFVTEADQRRIVSRLVDALRQRPGVDAGAAHALP